MDSANLFTNQFAPPQLATRVEVRVKCRNLLNKDVTSKSDPMVVASIYRGGRWCELGRTENIKNNLNPDFAKPFEMEYCFEEVQKLTFHVYDIDNSTASLSDDDYLGGIETTLSQVVGQSPFIKPLNLRNGAKAGAGSITLIAEEIGAMRDNLHLAFQGRGLDKKDFLGKSDPYLEIFRRTPDGSWLLIHRTEVIKNTLNPTWKTLMLKGNQINSHDPDQELQFKCHDYDNDGSHDFIGECYLKVGELLAAVEKPVEWACINPKKQAKKGASYKDSGKIVLTSCKIVQEYTFLDYIFGGCQLNFTVGIDFTASNGAPTNPNSLHYYDPCKPNEYMQAISAVGAIIQDYDSDKMFPALGFGARIPPSPGVVHEFALNFNTKNPFCNGVQGIIDAYQACLPRVTLYGPTNISPIIHHVARFAESAQQQQNATSYFVLLILTDGVITDMNDARSAIVYASSLPMSIIIVGVGGADFTDMHTLDGDDGVLRDANGTPVFRDIVQFVPFRKFKQGGRNSLDQSSSLAKEVLAEIPKQVTDYFRAKGLAPPARRPVQEPPPVDPQMAPPTASPTAPPTAPLTS